MHCNIRLIALIIAQPVSNRNLFSADTQAENLDFLGKLTDLLTLAAGNLESYDFLEDLPEFYQISLFRTNVGENIESLLPNACFIEINNELVRFETGEGYEQQSSTLIFDPKTAKVVGSK